MPTDCPKTSLDELEKVEMHLNKGTAFSGWLGIRVYTPERTETEVVWHLTRNPAPQFKNVMTIGIFGKHAFLIKDIKKLAKTLCMHPLQRKIHTILQSSTSRRKMRPR